MCLIIFLLSLFPCFIEIFGIKCNSPDPDQTPQNAASDLGLLHCLLMSFVLDARHKLVKLSEVAFITRPYVLIHYFHSAVFQ